MPTPEVKRRCFHLSPDRLVVGLLLVIGVLWLSDRFQWFGFNHHKGWMVLIAVAVVGVAGLVMLLWWAGALIFHWRFQFGIRSLLAFCLASSIAAGWLAVEVRLAKRQAEAIAAIRSSHGEVGYDWEMDADGKSEPSEPRWLRNMLGDDFFSTVIVILDIKITDAGLEHLKALSQIQSLHLDGTQITDAGLENLVGLAQLQELSLIGTEITDAGLEHLTGLTRLRKLFVFNTKITGDGVKKLQRALPKCEIYH